ncbi:Hypoxanthine phosphoribosyltransferase [Plasmodiophora brassicae]|uniref:Hypoxanthine phosphoribosyltransferase n=1 Tax=Plasmodiophora brassicae TaxID=37360 RepID=A0A0G4ISD5_PLABS|nr:hypothetical protein PBRA_006216 [Plasmodiophora brassicae]SPQ96079.1 unnamed protein product [Plasmodiophora brassicae]
MITRLWTAAFVITAVLAMVSRSADRDGSTEESRPALVNQCPQQWGRNIKKVLWTDDVIKNRIAEMAHEISEDYGRVLEGDERIVVIGLMNGAVMFTADLARSLTVANEIDFIRVSSYHGTNSTGNVRLVKAAEVTLRDRHVLLLEDLIDTGTTLQWVRSHLSDCGAKSIKIACLLDKTVKRKTHVPIDYVGWECPDEFVVGYGMDFNEAYRTLKFIGVLHESAYLM